MRSDVAGGETDDDVDANMTVLTTHVMRVMRMTRATKRAASGERRTERTRGRRTGVQARAKRQRDDDEIEYNRYDVEE